MKQFLIGMGFLIFLIVCCYITFKQSQKDYNLRKSYFLANGASSDQADSLARGMADHVNTVYMNNSTFLKRRALGQNDDALQP